jgi:hypothetical protein
MQQQAWEWLSTNLTSMMNQLRNGNVRNDSVKRVEFEKLQENLTASGWKKRTTGCLTEWYLFPPDGAGGTSQSITKTNKVIKSASAVAGVFLTVERDGEDADLGGGDELEDEGLKGPARGARDDDLLPFDIPDFLNEDVENVPSFVTGITHRSLVHGDQGLTSGRMLSAADLPDRRPTIKHQVIPGLTRRSVVRPLIFWRAVSSKRTRERARLWQ